MTWPIFRAEYPWPEHKPNCGPKVHGWVLHTLAWQKLLRERPAATVLEVGAWTGKNSLHLLETYPDVWLVAVDLWTPVGFWGEHWRKWVSEGVVKEEHDPLHLYQANLWPHRERAVTVRNDSVQGMLRVKDYIDPDIVYIDAAHDYDSVLADVTCALALFPNAIICGDDYEKENGVANAVDRIAHEQEKRLDGIGRFWRYV